MPVTLLASACPAPVTLGSVFYAADKYISGASVPPYDAFSTGMTTVTSPTLNKNLARNALAGRYGAGCYAVAYGLVVSAGSGLQVAVSAGHAMMDGPVEVATNQTVVVPSGSPRAWVWLKQDGTFVVQNNVTTKPAGNCVLLGSCVTDGSGVLSVDSSGVVYLQSGLPWRQTADTGAPSDAPDSSLRFYTQTLNGLYFWDGTLWRPQGASYLSIGGAKSDANYTLAIGEKYCSVLKLAWTGWTGTHNVVVPSVVGFEWTFINALGQSAQIIAASGTGITIANGKTARVMFDGSNIVRTMPDL